MQGPAFLSFDAIPQKRKRAEIACETCHSKKVRCDLQSRKAQGQPKCSYCSAAGRSCRQRASKRCKQNRQSSGSHTRHLSYPTPSETTSQLNDTGAGGLSGWDVVGYTSGVSSSYAALSPRQTHQVKTPNVCNDNAIVAADIIDPAGSTSRISVQNSMYTTSTTFMDAYELENETDALNQELAVQDRDISTTVPLTIDPSPELLQGFQETYYEHCYAFCPVLETTNMIQDLTSSRLLCNALAAAATHINPPMIPHNEPSAYYAAAKKLFYADEELDVLSSLKALSLFYWWSPNPPTVIHRDSSWWWQSVIIRHAQQMGIHREPAPDHPRFGELHLSLRKKLWWTAFARERLTALCQGRPSIIDLDDCTIQLPCKEDFPNSDDVLQKKNTVFMYWIQLCVILGKLAKHQLVSSKVGTTPLPADFVHQLLRWLAGVPAPILLNISEPVTSNFDIDVHQLYLPYLAAIIVLHLRHSPSTLPFAKPPAILAATCVVRILKDILARGRARSLMAITCWYTGISFLALLSARKHKGLSHAVDEDLDILVLAVEQLRLMWPTANIFQQGFKRLLSSIDPEDVLPELSEMLETAGHSTEGTHWSELFPFASPSTSKVAQHVLTDRQDIEAGQTDDSIPQPMMSYLQEFFDTSDSLDFLDLQLFP